MAEHISSATIGAPTQRTPRPRIRLPTQLRIAFIHPDLGIGGAERLVVDAAVGLQKRGHHVEIFTSHHEDGPGGRSFEETRNGTLRVHVLGSLLPPSLFNRFTILFSILRQLHLTILFLLASYLYFLPLPLLLPTKTPFKTSADWSVRRQLEPFDIIIIDQLSTCIPLLRWFGGNRVLFYCHFPDLLLSPARQDPSFGSATQFVPRWTPGLALSKLYRIPIDALEEVTTGEADKILVNSEFTGEVFERTFGGLRRRPRVVYPGIDVDCYGGKVDVKEEDKWLDSETPTLLSINRFESKKDISLAIEAFAAVKQEKSDLRLVLAGGFDPRLNENVTTLESLQALAKSNDLTYYTYTSSSSSLDSISTSPPSPKTRYDILFLLNMTSSQKSLLLSLPIVALLYTPSYEHLGIVPLEAMASGIPVLATNTGGPMETVVDDGLENGNKSTGLLRVSSSKVWKEAILDLLALSKEERKAIGERGKARTRELFSVSKLAEEFEKAAIDAAGIGEPIVFENGFLKLLMFVGVGAFVGISGGVAWWWGLKRAQKMRELGLL